MRTRQSESSKRAPSPRSAQIEFGFSHSFGRPRPLSSPLPQPPRRRRGVAPPSRRLVISAEAFAGPDGESGRYRGLVEACVAILATMAFGLGWAAYEFDRTAPATPLLAHEGYAPTAALGTAGVEDAAWTTDSFFATTEGASKR